MPRVNQELVNGIIKQHELWFTSPDHHAGERAGIKYKMLKGANFQNAKLIESEFYNANLVRANFEGANLLNSIITHSDLRGANFTGANLKNMSFSNSNLVGAKFGIEVRDVWTFMGATVSKDQLPWLISNPGFKAWKHTLRIV